jgi:aspartokinase
MPVVVLSAMGKTTNHLLAAGEGQGLTLAHCRAQLEDLLEHIAPVRAQLEHLRATDTG